MAKSYTPADIVTVPTDLNLDAMDRYDLVNLSCEHIRSVVSVAYDCLTDNDGGPSHETIANMLHGIETHLGVISAITKSAYKNGGAA